MGSTSPNVSHYTLITLCYVLSQSSFGDALEYIKLGYVGPLFICLYAVVLSGAPFNFVYNIAHIKHFDLISLPYKHIYTTLRVRTHLAQSAWAAFGDLALLV